MIVKLFDIQNNVIVPTEHCYTISTLKKIMDDYPEDYLKIYQYLFYMTCPNPDLNPFFNLAEDDKEEIILAEINAEFSSEDDGIPGALELCKQLYETPTMRKFQQIREAYKGAYKDLQEEQASRARGGAGLAYDQM